MTTAPFSTGLDTCQGGNLADAQLRQRDLETDI